MKPGDICNHCGAKTVEYRHRMNAGLVRALSSLARAAVRGRADVLASGLKLSHSELANLQKLAYWDLIRRAATGADDKKRGRWTVTTLGFEFLEARARVYRTVWTYRGETQRFEGDQVLVGDVLPDYQFVKDYAEAAVPVGRLGQAVQLALYGGLNAEGL